MFSSKERTKRAMKFPPEVESFTNPTFEMHEAIQNAKNLKTFVATWNVGGKPPETDLVLDDFLQLHSPSDIYVLGFQEIVPLNAGNVLVAEDIEPAVRWLALINKTLNEDKRDPHSLRKTKSSLDSKRSKLLTTAGGSHFFPKHTLKAISKKFRTEKKKKLKTCNCVVSEGERKYSRDSCFKCQHSDMNEDYFSSEEEDGPYVAGCFEKGQKYSLIVSKQMVGIFLTIWVRSELVSHVSHLKSSCISRGIMGFGNKGCISVSMLLYRTSFCFICSHLASGEKEGDELRRNSDVIEILKNTHFPRKCKFPNTGVPERVLDHERIIWLGDLNYRIALGHTDTLNLLKKKDWESLLNKDQLKIEREIGRVFKGWKEDLIKFAPTYKYSFNSDTYLGETNVDISPRKLRTPAWCDRILWKGEGIHQLSYQRKDSKKYRFSDHRPVYAIFSVEVLVTVKEEVGFMALHSVPLAQ